MDEDGNEPVKDFVLAQPDGAIAEILHVFKLLRIFNVGLRMPHAKKADKSGIRELRIRHGSDLYRVFYFAHTGQKFILLHAIKKKSDHIPESDMNKAIQRLNDYLSQG